MEEHRGRSKAVLRPVWRTPHGSGLTRNCLNLILQSLLLPFIILFLDIDFVEL